MPKDNKKRGRREQKKKLDVVADDEKRDPKRTKLAHLDDTVLPVTKEFERHEDDGPSHSDEVIFYGMLDQEEQDYFKRADELLELNQFSNEEERKLFLSSIYREADGKELKLANSQSLSRLMERLILLSTPKQLKTLFGKFSGHFKNLVQHRFASHCCEALFIQSAPVVTQELTAPLKEHLEVSEPDDGYVSMENLFLYTLNELEGSISFLMTDRFASHTLRVLLLILSGHAFPKPTGINILKSRRKESIRVSGFEDDAAGNQPNSRVVPESFQLALDKIILDIVSELDATFIRTVATHPVGNPVVQLLLELDLARPKLQNPQRGGSILQTLIPDDPPLEGTESSIFINGLLYDAVGSRLLETVVKFAPGKWFKGLYRAQFKERMGSLARSETAGFVVSRILERLSKEDLEVAVNMILPQVDSLVQRSRTSVIKTMIDRSAARRLDTSSLADTLKAACGGNAADRILRLLSFKSVDHGALQDLSLKTDFSEGHASSLHGSLLIQSMLAVPGALSELIFESILALDTPTLVHLAEDSASCYVLQSSITIPTSSLRFRRKIVQRFLAHVGKLATDTCGSHLIDAFWSATQELAFIRERIAEELLQHETSLRDSFVGRKIWRNWMMDLYKGRKLDWITRSKTGQRPELTTRTHSLTTVSTANEKSGIEIARESFAASKNKHMKVTGANNVNSLGLSALRNNSNQGRQ